MGNLRKGDLLKNISLGSHGETEVQSEEGREWVKDKSTRPYGFDTMSTNHSCENFDVCGGENFNCTNHGDCTPATNRLHCGGGGTIVQ